jgi:hypothetical protein
MVRIMNKAFLLVDYVDHGEDCYGTTVHIRVSGSYASLQEVPYIGIPCLSACMTRQIRRHASSMYRTVTYVMANRQPNLFRSLRNTIYKSPNQARKSHRFASLADLHPTYNSLTHTLPNREPKNPANSPIQGDLHEIAE